MTRASRYQITLFVLFVLWFGLMAIEPVSRSAWALENVLTVIAVVTLVVTHRRFPLSSLSYTTIFLFLWLHVLGSHYTYSLVPYADFFGRVFGDGAGAFFDAGRNHFDRFVHFMYGLLLAYPIREVFLRIADVRGFWGYFLPLDLTMSTSMIYELIEWGAAEIFGGDLGMAYLGTQGDVWDAHKDMALASLGAIIAMTITLGVNVWLQRDFTREWAESLRVKRAEPLGEVEIERMRSER